MPPIWDSGFDEAVYKDFMLTIEKCYNDNRQIFESIRECKRDRPLSPEVVQAGFDPAKYDRYLRKEDGRIYFTEIGRNTFDSWLLVEEGRHKK